MVKEQWTDIAVPQLLKSQLAGACPKASHSPFLSHSPEALLFRFSTQEGRWSKEPTTWKQRQCSCSWCPAVSGWGSLRVSSGNSAHSNNNWGVCDPWRVGKTNPIFSYIQSGSWNTKVNYSLLSASRNWEERKYFWCVQTPHANIYGSQWKGCLCWPFSTKWFLLCIRGNS